MFPSTGDGELLLYCPICGCSAVKEVALALLHGGDTAGDRPVGGVKAFTCTVNQHVFFLLVSQLDDAKRLY
jgi:hypothetical protein